MRKLKKMREKVKEELDHISRGDFNQNLLRSAYWGIRLHGLGKKAEREISKEEALVNALKFIKKDTPNFCLRYDETFFDKKSLCKLSKDNPSVYSCLCRAKRKSKKEVI
ncbi:MAG: hypothetical protein L6408_05930 [Nanoarchaeota archaeon]|nr:hypothetical protein [Nanoarchaeota archaeon]